MTSILLTMSIVPFTRKPMIENEVNLDVVNSTCPFHEEKMRRGPSSMQKIVSIDMEDAYVGTYC